MANSRDLVFATINLLNLHLWDGHTYSNRTTAFKDEETYKRRIAWLADRILWLEADVIAFQELWSVAALNDVFVRAGLADQFELIARDAPGIGKPQVALALRRGLLAGEARWVEFFPETFKFRGFREKFAAEEAISISIDRFSRPVLQATIQPPGNRPKAPPVNIFVAHLKSKAPTELEAVEQDTALQHHASITKKTVAHVRRMMEAGALRVLLDQVMKSEESGALSPTVVIGDLNDDTHAVSTELLSGEPTYRVAVSSMAGRQSDKGLYSCETLQQYRSQRHVYYTYNYKNTLSTLDHIMVSEEFYDHSKKRQWSFAEMEIVNDHLAYADETRTEKQRLLDATGAVDHGLVRAKFVWDPIQDDIKRIAESYRKA